MKIEEQRIRDGKNSKGIYLVNPLLSMLITLPYSCIS